MAKATRMNCKQESRATLRELERKNVLRRERVGIRNIIKASTNQVEQVGFDVNALHGNVWRNPQLPNFCPGAVFATGWVAYEGGRAYLSATQGRAGWQGHVLDPATHFPVNELATRLLRQPCTRNASFSSDVPMVGDAIITTDHRRHWVLRPHQRDYTDEDLTFFASMLETPHDLISDTWRSYVFFHEEPRVLDLVAMKLRWV